MIKLPVRAGLEAVIRWNIIIRLIKRVNQAVTHQAEYGQGDTTYQAAGGQAGIRKLVDCFFDFMASEAKYSVIYDWHPQDKEVSRDKLALFLCGWMGGPRPFVEKYGQIRIPEAHRHLAITAVERDLWLDCMSRALNVQDYPADLVEYLQQQLYIPAERVRKVCMGE